MRPTRTRFDRLAKHVVEGALGSSCTVKTELEVAAEAQSIDVYAEPDPARSEERMRAGLLGRMAEGVCLIEAFHQPPRAEHVHECVLKQHAVHAQRRRDARRAGRAKLPTLPTLWLVSAGDPVGVRRDFELRPLRGWPKGCFRGARASGVRLIVVSMLPNEPSTLLIRLMGAGPTLRAALAELAALPLTSWERGAAGPWIESLHFVSLEPGASAATKDEEDTMDAVRMWKESQHKAREEGRVEGRLEGRLEGQLQGRLEGQLDLLIALFGRRLKRALTPGEEASLRARGRALGVARLEEVLDLRRPSIAAWLADDEAK